MVIGIYYHILEIGIVYEKGKKKGRFWKLGEKKRLKDECIFWKSIINYIKAEEDGKDCADLLFDEMKDIVSKYDVKNYSRIIEMKETLILAHNSVEYKKDNIAFINDFLTKLLQSIEFEIDKIDGKTNVYRILETMHNLPRVFHGKDELGGGDAILLDDAVKYATWSMPDRMKEDYKRFIE